MISQKPGVVVVVEQSETLESLIKHAGPEDIFVSSNEHLVRRVRDRGRLCEWLGGYLSPEDVLSIERRAWTAANRFADHPLLRSITEFRSIPLCAAGVLEMNMFFVWWMKSDLALTKFLTHTRATEFICVRGPRGFRQMAPAAEDLILGRLLEEKGQRVRWIRPRASVRNVGRLGRTLIKESLRKLLAGVWRVSSANRPLDRTKKTVLICASLAQVRNLMPELRTSFNGVYLDGEFRLNKLPELRSQAVHYHIAQEKQTHLVRQFLTKIKARYNQALEIMREDICSSAGLSPGPWAQDFFDHFWYVRLPVRARHVEAFHKSLSRFKPDLVLLDEDVLEFRRTLALTARSAQVPSAVLCHNSTPTILGIELMPLIADHMIVASEFIKNNFVWAGMPKDRIWVAGGVSRYDHLIRPRPTPSCEAIRKKLSIPPEDRIVVLASTLDTAHLFARREFWQIHRAIQEALEVFCNRERLWLVVKLHPITDALHEKTVRALIASTCSQRARLVRDIDFATLLSISDLVLTFFSSTIAEAMLLNKPVVVLDYLPQEIIGGLFGDEAQSTRRFLVSERCALREVSDNFLRADPAQAKDYAFFRSQVMKNWLGEWDGKSSARLADRIRAGMTATGASVPGGVSEPACWVGTLEGYRKELVCPRH